MTHESLAQRIERLEAIEDIRRLKACYCLHCDRGYEPDALAALFTQDAVWDGGELGRHEGREAIRAFFARASGRFPWAAHLVTNPVIEADGGKATGLWRMIMPCTLVGDAGETSAIQVAEYEERYRREDGRWLISHLSVRRRRLTLDRARWQER